MREGRQPRVRASWRSRGSHGPEARPSLPAPLPPRSARQSRPRRPRDRPVFLDRSGRRRRLTVLLGTGLATALMAGLGALAVALSGSTAVDIPGFPDSDRHADAPDGRPPATTPGSPPGDGRPAGAGSDPTSVAATSTVTSSSERPGNGRNPTHTPPRGKPTKTR
jgi:hypothetical protein